MKKLLIVVLAVVFVFCGAGYARITKGPLLLRVYQNRAALMWESDTQGPGKVSYNEGQKLTNHIDTEPQPVEYEIEQKRGTVVKKTVFIHKTWLENLQPGRTYNYRVADVQGESKMYSFRTQPAKSDEVTFIVYGDSRSNPAVHRKIVEQMIKKKVDFVINSGDLVHRGWNYKQWSPQFFEPLKGLGESVPIYAIKGNHDRGEPNYYEKLLIPPGEENDFAFDYGPAHFFCADNITNFYCVDNITKDVKAEELLDACLDNITKGVKAEELLDAIAADVRSSKAQWKFVSYHVPSLNFGKHWSMWGYPDAISVLAKAGVDFAVTGHSHQYERFRPVAPVAGVGGSYVTYITSGGGGAKLYDVRPTVYHAKTGEFHHFCLFVIKANKLTMDTIDIDGKLVDHLEVTKTDSGLNQEYLQTAVPAEAVQLHQNLYKALKRPLTSKPQKNQPFTIRYNLSVPVLGEEGKITFELRSEEGLYELPKSKLVTIPKGGGTVNVELTATALAEVIVPTGKRKKPKPIVPALWTDCEYEIGQIRESMSQPVLAKSEKQKRH